MERDEHLSPDGQLTRVVIRGDGDTTIGFDGFEWHTHGDLLAASYPLADTSGLTPEMATRRFVDDVVSNRAVITVLKSSGKVRDVWVTNDVEADLRYRPPDEHISPTKHPRVTRPRWLSLSADQRGELDLILPSSHWRIVPQAQLPSDCSFLRPKFVRCLSASWRLA